MATSKDKEELTMDDVQDLFSNPENEVKQKFIAWDKIGMTVTGYFVDKRLIPNKLKGEGISQTLYTLMQKDGTSVIVAGRYGNPVQTFAGMEQTPLGAFVGFKYEGDRESEKKGYHPTKIIRVFVKKGKDGMPVLYPDMIAKFKGEVMDEAIDDINKL